MRQASLKLKRYASVINAIDDVEKLALRSILGAFALLAVCYVLILGTIVFNITERKTVEAKARTLTSEVSDLELTYLNKSNSIDLDLSHAMGFKEVTPKFAIRKTINTVGMAPSTNEI